MINIRYVIILSIRGGEKKAFVKNKRYYKLLVD